MNAHTRPSSSTGLLASLLWLLSCGGDPVDTGSLADGGAADGGAVADGGATDGGGDDPVPRWTGKAQVQVVDPDGQPVAEAWVMLGGALEEDWVLTDVDGLATILVTDDGVTDRYLLAGKVGWISGGENLLETVPPDDLVTIVMEPLPDQDNPDYSWQPGGNGDSMTSAECGHCHMTMGDDWAYSSHREAARNSRTWDLYTGSASQVADADCSSFGGWLATGVLPGSPDSTEQRCYTGDGVLPLLNEGCGGVGQPACDHPDQRPSLSAYGSCGDCHVPATDGGVPGAIDLAAATGIGFDEGVTCDFCHKVRSVEPGPAPGLDGSITLERPSQPTMVTGQEFDPITFGPYADVIVGIMKGSYAPQMRQGEWCSSCHEYARDALDPSLPIDATRWPQGLPLHETWTEVEYGPYGDLGMNCQSCHMPVLDEESSTYDISEGGLSPSFDQGWLRPLGEVRHHHFPATGELEPPGFSLDAEWTDGRVAFEVTVSNWSAAHAVPTGEPMRQLLVLVDAVDASGAPAVLAEGPTIPDVGGYSATGVLGDDAVLSGSAVELSGAALPSGVATLRIVRATGEWADDSGPGTRWFEDLSAEERGLPLYRLVDQVPVTGVSGDTATLARAPVGAEPGDRVYLCTDDEYAGAAGWLYAKTLVDADGSRGVAHFRAVDIASDNRIAPGVRARTAYAVDLPGGTVTARLVRRRYAAPVAARYGWDPGDLELLRASAEDPGR